MRSSRISKDTAKVFENHTTTTPRRTTRSLSRFVYTAGAAPPASQDGSPTLEMEDTFSPPKKRARTTISTAMASLPRTTRSATTRSPVKSVKDEPVEESIQSISWPPRRIRKPATKKTGDKDIVPLSSRNASQIPEIEDNFGLSPKKRIRTTTTTRSPIKSIKHEAVEQSPPPEPSPTRRARKPATKKTDPSTGETTISPPSNWEEMYYAVKKMRAPGGTAHGAAVDTMGCERLADRTASARDQRFHTLISLMLSSQTKDTVNAVAMERLKTELPAYKAGAPAGLNLENILAVDAGVLNGLIWAVGFHNNKTKYIKQTALLLRDKWHGDIPDTIPGLTSLPGVGPKMAYLCLSAAWDRTEGIGVDVHVHRITNLWGWHKTKTPEETRLALQSWLPRDKWREINWLLVGFGQTVCLPVGRHCGDCTLGLQGLCKAADRKKVMEGRRVKMEETVVEDDDERRVNKKEVVVEETIVKEEVVNEASGYGG
ncbi:hypothetical protein E4U31_000911 [Claviceps sp. LM219 group G6]|nr:hypothetical protein E4U15_001497 [Claviceps sp. LM218 group G6]KAG6106252.1 hypothetical protein E4U31_000911 [Claviceps sp. LM219 group G6]KAG6122985.1 hypothetical protein E4U14_002355 [Claviceps sp. LM454 group G7]